MMIQKFIAKLIPLFPKRFIWIFSKRYIAGAKVEDALRVVEELNSKKMLATIDILGESVDRREQAKIYQQLYLNTIGLIVDKRLKTSFSLKPTMFGLLWDYDFCYLLIREIVEKVHEKGYFIRLDMEDSTCTQLELNLFKSLYKEFGNSVSIVLQACLKRTYEDIAKLAEISEKSEPVNIRLCKGIYDESHLIAYKGKEEIRQNYLHCLDLMLSNNLFAAIATHDKYLVDGSLELLRKYKKSKSDYEFQMLYGVTPLLRKQLVDSGHALRVYVPFGEQWLRYCVRRLKENPAMVRDIILALFVRK